MDLLTAFRHYLFSQKRGASPATVKNYLADVSRFIKWYEITYQRLFSPVDVTKTTLELYKASSLSAVNQSAQSTANSSISQRSFQRHMAALRKFYQFLGETNNFTHDPFKSEANSDEHKVDDPGYIGAFKDYLFTQNASKHTIKNYINDIKQFIQWLQAVRPQKTEWEVTSKPLLHQINNDILKEYKERLLRVAGFSAISVNRKLSSIRKYISWAGDNNLLEQPQNISFSSISNYSDSVLTPFYKQNGLINQDNLNIPQEELLKNTSPLFAPLRVVQKVRNLMLSTFDFVLISPFIFTIKAFQHLWWRLTGATIFLSLASSLGKKDLDKTLIDTAIVTGMFEGKESLSISTPILSPGNVGKAFYAPHTLSTAEMGFVSRILFHLRHTRPEWYKRYHSLSVVHYLHFGVLIVFLGVFVVWLYPRLFGQSSTQLPTMAVAGDSATRKLISFQGKVTNMENLSNLDKLPIRFALYSHPSASGSAMQWQEVTTVSVQEDGTFSATLGLSSDIPNSLLNGQLPLHLGVSVDNDSEMRPRQQLATSSFAGNSAKLGGMQPITAENAGNKNVVLALDSAGNLSVGGDAGTIFQATGGPLTLTGQAMLIQTNPGSNKDVILEPDGLGRIDVRKALVNSASTDTSESAGAVLVDDSMIVVATTSGIAALSINQQNTGNIISASSSGFARFSLDYIGNAMFSGDLAVNGNNLTTTSKTFSIANSGVINLNLGGQATAISIGGNTGLTTIHNSLSVQGDVTLGNATSSAITIAGKFAQDTDLIPATTTGTNDLGSQDTPWDTLYIKNIVTSSNGQFGENIQLGSADTSLATVRLSGVSGANSFVNTGNFGVGTNNPLERLHVLGDARVGTSGTNGCVKGFDGTALVGSCSSDVRLKKNIASVENVLEALVQLRPVTYNMRSDEFPEYGFGTGTVYGLIAQEVEGIFPHLVQTDANGFKTVKYGPELSMLSIQGIRELNNKVQEQKELLTAISSQLSLNDSGNLTILANEEDVYIVQDNQGTIITRLGAFAKLFAADITAGIIRAKEASFDRLAVASEQITIAGMNLDEWISARLAKQGITITSTNGITSPLVTAESVQSNIISPLSDDSDIAIKLDNSQISILNSNSSSGSAVASFDRDGNATFSGTLKADKIVANSIEGLDEKLATLAAQQASSSATVTNIYNVYTAASNSATSTTTNTTNVTNTSYTSASESADVTHPIVQHLDTASVSANFTEPYALSTIPYADLASVSASLAYIPNFKTDFATISQSLMVLGPASMTDLTVSNQIAVGGNLILSENSINTLGAPLDLQPLRQGIISMMGGLVAIDTSGNLAVNGNAVFDKDVNVQGTLAAKIISPIGEGDLVIKLGTNKSYESNMSNRSNHGSSILVADSSGSARLSINSLGDLIASGTATLGSLNIVRGASADTSSIETVASGSAGLGTITEGYTSRTIYSPFVTEDSLIYITPRSETTVIPYLARQTTEDKSQGTLGSFTVQIPYEVDEDLMFNWWIVN